MDTYIFLSGLLSFCLFLAVIAVLFRFTRREAAIVWMIRTFVGIAVVTTVVFAGSWSLTEYIWWVSLYGLLTALFIFGPFSIMEASITLRIFSDIARSGDVITDRSHIIRRRIERLLYSGEIVKNKGTFMLGKTSYFRLREIFLHVLRILFP